MLLSTTDERVSEMNVKFGCKKCENQWIELDIEHVASFLLKKATCTVCNEQLVTISETNRPITSFEYDALINAVSEIIKIISDASCVKGYSTASYKENKRAQEILDNIRIHK